MTKWTKEEAIAVCTVLEAIAPEYGMHVALTGGLLYKEGDRKDLDVVLYRIRAKEADIDGFFSALPAAGFSEFKPYGFVTKAKFGAKVVDFLYPETEKKAEYKVDEK